MEYPAQDDQSWHPEGPALCRVLSFFFVPAARGRFWRLFWDGGIEVCVRDPGYEAGLAMTAHIRTLTEIWLGHLPLDLTIRKRELLLEGDTQHFRAFPRWLNLSYLALREKVDAH